jgi:Ca2+ transporting ATPase
MTTFDIQVKELTDMLVPTLKPDDQQAHLAKHGQIEGLAKKLRTNLTTGLQSDNKADHEARIAKFGKNEIPVKPPKSFLYLMWEAVQDTTLLILIGCALFSLLLALLFHEEVVLDEEYSGAKEPNVEWIEGVAILVAVLVVVLVTAFNDWSKEKQFRGLQTKISSDQKISVIRDGSIIELPVKDILVGDICQIFYGHIVPADGIVIESNDLKIDESSMTGETDHIKKSVNRPMVFSSLFLVFCI